MNSDPAVVDVTTKSTTPDTEQEADENNLDVDSLSGIGRVFGINYCNFYNYLLTLIKNLPSLVLQEPLSVDSAIFLVLPK
jgi:hypothetical protein